MSQLRSCVCCCKAMGGPIGRSPGSVSMCACDLCRSAPSLRLRQTWTKKRSTRQAPKLTSSRLARSLTEQPRCALRLPFPQGGAEMAAGGREAGSPRTVETALFLVTRQKPFLSPRIVPTGGR